MKLFTSERRKYRDSLIDAEGKVWLREYVEDRTLI